MLSIRGNIHTPMFFAGAAACHHAPQVVVDAVVVDIAGKDAVGALQTQQNMQVSHNAGARWFFSSRYCYVGSGEGGRE